MMKLSGVVGTLTTVSCAGIISDVFPAVLSRRRSFSSLELHCHVHLSVFGSAAFELIYLFP